MTPSVPKADNKDPDYLEHCRDLCRLWRVPCFVCRTRNGTVVPHHVRNKQVYGDKWNAVFLCGRCHLEIHHLGRHTFCHVNNLSLGILLDEATRLYDEYLTIHRGNNENSS